MQRGAKGASGPLSGGTFVIRPNADHSRGRPPTTGCLLSNHNRRAGLIGEQCIDVPLTLGRPHLEAPFDAAHNVIRGSSPSCRRRSDDR